MKHRITILILLIAGVVFAACNNEREQPETPPVPPVITMTVEAVKGGADASTRALKEGTDATTGKKTVDAYWTEGEMVRVVQTNSAGKGEVIGTLQATASDNGRTKLTGTLTKQPEETKPLTFYLHNADQDYTAQTGTLADISTNHDFVWGVVPAGSFTNNTMKNTVTVTGNVVNMNQVGQAIVKFTLTDKADGTTPVAARKLTISEANGRILTKKDIATQTPVTGNLEITPSTTGNVLWVSMAPYDSHYATAADVPLDLTLTAETDNGDIYTYTKSGIHLTANRYYAITVKMEKLAIGNLYYSDGTWSQTLIPAKTPIGVVAYVGNDVFSEKGVTLRDGKTTLKSHGLVLCLKNAGSSVVWSSITGKAYQPYAYVDETEALKRTEGVSGYTVTKALASSNYPACQTAWNYISLAAPPNTTGWFLPSEQQWVKIVCGLGGLSESAVEYSTYIAGDAVIKQMEDALKKAGNGAYDLLKVGTMNWYWSSSEFDDERATGISIFEEDGPNLRFIGTPKNDSEDTYVRPVLAF